MRAPIDNVDVLKVGTNLLMHHQGDGEALNYDMFSRIAVQAFGEANVVIVSSAAITAGMAVTDTLVRPDKEAEMPELQRLASIGWRHVLNAWDASLFRKTSGGLLLTRQDLSHRRERQEALQVIHALLSHKDVPIVNENDAITHEEIAFGDNDRLAATLAASLAKSALFGSQVRLFLLSDVNGVYADRNNPASRIPVIANLEEYAHLAEGPDSDNGTGGMVTKFAAVAIAQAAGIDTWLYDPRLGKKQQALDLEIGTYFPAPEST